MSSTGPESKTLDLLREKALAAQDSQMLRWWPNIEQKFLTSLAGELKVIANAWETTESGTQARLKHSEAQKKYFKESADSAKASISTLTTELDSAKASISTLTTELDSAKASISTLTTELDSAKATISTLTTELDSAKASISTLTTELDSAKATISTLTTELDSARRTSSELQAQASASISTMHAEKRRLGLLLLLLLAVIGLLLLKGT